MVDIFFILIVIILIGLFGGLLYLIYLPFKSRLKKSGKLTDKLNRQINRIFVLSLCLSGVVLYCYKDYRTPSKDRLEKASDVKLPTDFKVLKDEYQNMWQDYCIRYYIQLDKNATKELVKNIKFSQYYNDKSFYKVEWTEGYFVRTDTGKPEWCKSLKGFNFNRQDKLTSYSIELDTVTNIVKYNECAD
jgi:uncharacterized protein (DUF927 family)